MSKSIESTTSEDLAKYYKFLRQGFQNKKQIPLSRIRASTLYTQYKKHFNKLLEICKKYDIDHEKYIKFCVYIKGIKDPSLLVDISSFVQYGNHLKKENHYLKIHEYYVKSARNIAEYCIQNNIGSSLDYVRILIKSGKLAYEFITGRISKYYIASIQNIKKIYEKMDCMSRDELGIIVNVSDELNQDVQEAFKMIEGRTITPIRFTDSLIEKLKTENK